MQEKMEERHWRRGRMIKVAAEETGGMAWEGTREQVEGR
jgi:hypothetical protein